MGKPRGTDTLAWWLDESRIDYIPETGCWISHASLTGKGYPHVKKEEKNRKLGHLVLENFVGPRPDGMEMCHSCDIPSCVNPDHLRWDTRKANNDDKERRGRGNHPSGDQHGARLHPENLTRGDDHWSRRYPERVPLGERRSNAKLTTQRVRSLRHIYKMGGVSQVALGKIFGIDQTHVSSIVNRKSWAHIA